MLFITATDTDVGKTFFSKSLIKHFIESGNYQKNEIAYFKPIQCGSPTDFDEIKKETQIEVFCTYSLKFPASPDYASRLEDLEISLEKIKTEFDELKKRFKYIIVEGAGGAAVPLNKKELVSDLILKLDLETVVVIRPDLGTINHSLLTIEHLINKGIQIKGLYVSAKSRELSEAYDITNAERSQQNLKALETILEFTKTRKLELDDIK